MTLLRMFWANCIRRWRELRAEDRPLAEMKREAWR